MQRGTGMWRDDPLVRVFICLFWLIGPPLVVGTVSFAVWTMWSLLGVRIFGFQGFTFWQIFGFLYIVGTLVVAWFSREDLVRILRNSWLPMWYHPLEAVLLRLLQLIFVFAALATLAFALTTAWNWVIVRLCLLTFQDVLIALLIVALPYLLFLEWLDLGGRLWERFRFR